MENEASYVDGHVRYPYTAKSKHTILGPTAKYLAIPPQTLSIYFPFLIIYNLFL